MNGLQKFYTGLWIVFALIIAGLAVSGNLTMLAFTVLGFTSFGLIFMGMMCVLPTTSSHHAVPSAPSAAAPRSVRMTMRRFINAWAHANPVELRQPTLHYADTKKVV
jgi:hypothetical protein